MGNSWSLFYFCSFPWATWRFSPSVTLTWFATVELLLQNLWPAPAPPTVAPLFFFSPLLQCHLIVFLFLLSFLLVHAVELKVLTNMKYKLSHQSMAWNRLVPIFLFPPLSLTFGNCCDVHQAFLGVNGKMCFLYAASHLIFRICIFSCKNIWHLFVYPHALCVCSWSSANG